MTIAGRTPLDRASRVASRSTRARPPTCPDENELVLLADGLVTMTKRAVIDRHLDNCPRCTRLVAELAGMALPVRPVPERYKVIRQLGAVWEAEDKHLARRVALKFIRADDRERLSREARTLAQVRHPNVVRVYDVGDAAGEVFLALELVIGTDVRTWLTTAPRTTDQILGVWLEAAAGLAAVHRAGIVHRDVRPENILVADDGRILLGDFGLAAADTGAAKADQYALCAAISEALAGGAEPHISAALARGLDPTPAKRWPDVDALVAALRTPRPLTKSRVALLAIGAALFAAAATIGVLALRPAVTASSIGADVSSAIGRATSQLEHGDAASCLDILDRLPSAPPAMRADVDSLRAMCVMKAGDCAGGKRLLEATGRTWDAKFCRRADK